ncbi:MAG: BsuPI-related putative proteinase inhibitor [Candidatus Eremiobacteraeota bacterium]|nr:BsuPI-related putative proteinase inhibitor [Candidatus Eremiobacteraeota bacterium]
MSSWFSPRDDYSLTRERGRNPHRAGNNLRSVRARPLQFTLTMVLLTSLLLLAMAGITRYTVGEPLLPDRFAKLIHHKQPALPPGMTWDLEILNPATKRPYEELPEVGIIVMRLAVTNDSALPIRMQFRSGNQCEFILRRVFNYVDGFFALPLEVWRSSYFHNISVKPTSLFLQPGETKVYTATFEFNALNAQQTPVGEYRIVAVIDATASGRWETSIPINKPL